MTVLNVTNATLKGAVKGPTFTGNVDGSTFSGDVTYTDTTTPPVEPPPTGNTAGLIANFTAAYGTIPMTIAGQATKNLNANYSGSGKTHVLQKIDDYTLKYEVRSGDRAGDPSAWMDSSECERSETELMPRYALGKLITVEYGFMLHSDFPPNTAQWVVIGQCHFDKGSGSPPFCLSLQGEKMRCELRAPNNRQQIPWTDTAPIQRGHKYLFKIELKINAGGTGTCKVWRDGTQIVNFSGALGSGVANDTHYWKQGIYRLKTADPLAASYYNTSVTAV